MLQLLPSGGLKAVVDDTSPVLGGNLDGGGFNISNVDTGIFDRLEVDGTTFVANRFGYPDKVGIGTNKPLYTLDIRTTSSPSVSVINTSNVASYQALSYMNHAVKGGGFFLGHARGTFSNPLSVANGDRLGWFLSRGYDGSSFQHGAGINFYVDGAVSSGVVPTKMVIETGSSTSTREERLTILSGGNVGFWTPTPKTVVDINSDIFRLRTAKTPASAGATGFVGSFCWDSGYIYVCVATDTWKQAELLTW